jgi:hypothetical protein
MLKFPFPIRIRSASTGWMVSASLIEISVQIARERIDLAWWKEAGVDPQAAKREPDFEWVWRDVIKEWRRQYEIECIGIQTMDGQVQGATILIVDDRICSVLEPGKKSVFIERLATAPHNRDWLTNTPLYKDVGSMLLRCAVTRSLELGRGGRISLESVPTAVSFYKSRKFVVTGSSDDGNIVMERPAADAQTWRLI